MGKAFFVEFIECLISVTIEVNQRATIHISNNGRQQLVFLNELFKVTAGQGLIYKYLMSILVNIDVHNGICRVSVLGRHNNRNARILGRCGQILS